MRETKPYGQAKTTLGGASSAWEKLLGYIRYNYIVDEKWAPGKPTHKHYDNLFVRRAGKSLIGLSIREGYFIASITLGKAELQKFDAAREGFSAAACELYDAADTLHDGKWLGFKVCDESPLEDIVRLLRLKGKPNRKVLPAKSVEKCGQLDLGLSGEDITSRLGVQSEGGA